MNSNTSDDAGPPGHAMAALSKAAPAQAKSRLESCSGWFMLINGGTGLLVSASVALLHHSAAGMIDSPPYVSLLGALAGLLALRAAWAGLVAGSIFYGLQVLSYHSIDQHINFRSGLSYGVVVHLPHGTLVINIIAVLGLLVTSWMLAGRSFRSRR